MEAIIPFLIGGFIFGAVNGWMTVLRRRREEKQRQHKAAD